MGGPEKQYERSTEKRDEFCPNGIQNRKKTYVVGAKKRKREGRVPIEGGRNKEGGTVETESPKKIGLRNRSKKKTKRGKNMEGGQTARECVKKGKKRRTPAKPRRGG